MVTLITRIVGRWSDSGVIEKSNEDVYIYGLDLLLFSVLNIITILILSVIFNKLIESVVMLITIIPLQAYGGGYHAKTHFRCFLIMIVGWFIVVHLLPYITPVISLIVCFVSVLIVFLLAPVSHANVKMSIKHMLKLRIYVRIIVIGVAVASMMLVIFISDYTEYGIILSIGLGIVAISMLCAYCLNLVNQYKLRI
ncbi:MAG: accessory gene regulator B family protein [Oscillospiraceae bacterium]|jgi:accessory gene regulator B|nr:accessory gene regulator B family protein [Oscillospiraceae bacterium]